ncbi:MAG: hypothetical protein H6Q52_2914 [Deltaproteobacteria bacterium]|nr:hypothetical protein [Deltaproteobacteria bacterium]
MKVKEPCRSCLEGLIRKTVSLSGGNERVASSSLALLDRLYTGDATPPAIANMLLDHIRRTTGVYDPYATIKYREYREAVSFMRGLQGEKPVSLSDHIHVSALGNSTDFFTGGSFDPGSFVLKGDMDKIEDIFDSGNNEILMLGDNMGDFFFDVPLARFFEERGRKVFYAVKGSPVQNDISMEDIVRYDLGNAYSSIVSTEKAHVGLSREDIAGVIERLWKGDGPVIAKGMGNFETISEFDDERQVVYIMKVKCPAVAQAVQSGVGTYIAYVR